MSVSLRELADSRSFDLNAKDGRATFHYFAVAVGEANPENAVYVALLADTTLAPFVWNNLYRGRPSAKPLGGGWYDVTLPYGLPQGLGATDPNAVGTPPNSPPPMPPPPSPSSNDAVPRGTSMRIGSKPPRIYRSFQTVESVIVDYLDLAGFDPSDYKKAIHVGKDGKVEGVEMPDPTNVMTLSRRFNQVTWRWILRLAECCWHPSLNNWAGFPPGVPMIIGGHLDVQKDGTVDVSVDVGIDPGEGEIDVRGDGKLMVSARPPWHYVWAVYDFEKDDGSGRLVSVPTMAYVEKLAGREDYSSLGLF